MLRRSKINPKTGHALVNLPAKTVDLVNIDLDEEERAFYDAMEIPSRITVNRWFQQGEGFLRIYHFLRSN